MVECCRWLSTLMNSGSCRTACVSAALDSTDTSTQTLSLKDGWFHLRRACRRAHTHTHTRRRRAPTEQRRLTRRRLQRSAEKLLHLSWRDLMTAQPSFALRVCGGITNSYLPWQPDGCILATARDIYRVLMVRKKILIDPRTFDKLGFTHTTSTSFWSCL